MNSQTYNKNLLIKKISKILIMLNEEIKKIQQGQEAIDEIFNLQFMVKILENIQDSLSSRKFQNNFQYQPIISRIIVDTWPPNDILGNEICQVEYEYLNLIKKINNHLN